MKDYILWFYMMMLVLIVAHTRVCDYVVYTVESACPLYMSYFLAW